MQIGNRRVNLKLVAIKTGKTVRLCVQALPLSIQ
jgi:hypothetical protein